MRNGPYTLIVASPTYPGKKYRGRYVYEHIHSYWSYTGKVPPKGYEIHHKDNNHRNNKPWNLEMVTSREHKKLHGEAKKLACRINTICGFCGVPINLKGNTYRSRIKQNKRNMVFCSRSCGSKKQDCGVA